MKTVLLTGASSGIGLATGLQLASEGYVVHGIGRSFDEELSYPENFFRYCCDITDTKELSKTLQTIKTALGTPAPDILIHNAGIGLYGLQETLESADLQALIRTNLEAPILITTEFLSYMKQRKSGDMGFFASLIFGFVFSVGWTPCVGVFLGSALMLASQQGSATVGIVMLLCYSLGLGIPFMISAVLIDSLKGAFTFIKRNYKIINTVCGILLISVGILMATGLLGRFLTILS